MRKQKTNEEFLREIASVNSNIAVLGKYVNARTKILVKCNTCAYEWEALPPNLLKGQTCPRCSHKKLGKILRMSEKEFLNKASTFRPDIEVVGKYEHTREKILCRCKKEGHYFKIKAGILLTEVEKDFATCPYCREKIKEQVRNNVIPPPLFLTRESRRLSQKEVEEKIRKSNPNILIISNFTTSREKIKLKCKKCGCEWECIANNVINRNTGCPQCNESKGERKIKLFLEENKISYCFQYKFDNCKDKRPLPFDFYLPDYNLCIEYDGEFHYLVSAFHGGEDKFLYTKKHDEIKNSFCKKNNIALLRIKYTNYKNIENILCKELKVGDASYGNQCNIQ